MRLLGLFLVTSILFALPRFSAAELVYTPVPMENAATVVAAHTPLVRYLSEQLGEPVRIRFEAEASTILRLVRAGEIDLVQLGPIPYLFLQDSFPHLRALLVFHEPDGQPTLTCALVTSFDGPKSLREIDAGTIALPQALSTCGDYAFDRLLREAGKDPDRFRRVYQGNQTNLALAVLRGEFVLGVLKTSVAKKYEPLTLRILERTPPLPGTILAVNTQRVDRERAERIRTILATAPPEVRKEWFAGSDGFAPVTEDFDLIQGLRVTGR